MFGSLRGAGAIPSHALPGGTEGPVTTQALCHPLKEAMDKWVRKCSLRLMKSMHSIITSVEVQSKSARLKAASWISL